jgi:hypothetical protein
MRRLCSSRKRLMADIGRGAKVVHITKRLTSPRHAAGGAAGRRSSEFRVLGSEFTDRRPYILTLCLNPEPKFELRIELRTLNPEL